jgi:hypothetical protein
MRSAVPFFLCDKLYDARVFGNYGEDAIKTRKLLPSGRVFASLLYPESSVKMTLDYLSA